MRVVSDRLFFEVLVDGLLFDIPVDDLLFDIPVDDLLFEVLVDDLRFDEATFEFCRGITVEYWQISLDRSILVPLTPLKSERSDPPCRANLCTSFVRGSGMDGVCTGGSLEAMSNRRFCSSIALLVKCIILRLSQNAAGRLLWYRDSDSLRRFGSECSSDPD